MQVDVALAYAVPLTASLAIYLSTRRNAESINSNRLALATEADMLDPASLHPIVDPSKCIGCESCVRACPEGRILGLIQNKAQLVEPTLCIGHGTCKAACPTGAITLVFGTERRGVDIPLLGPNFETTTPGIFISGELGGMGLISRAIEQGRKAIDSIASSSSLKHEKHPGVLDVVIVGAGPSGLSASLAALKRRMRFVTLEQDTLGGAVAHYPRGKVVMTQPFTMPIAGTFNFGELSKEELIAFFERVVAKTRLKINTGERVDAILREEDHFIVQSTHGEYRAKSVLLAIGRRGTPRKLEVPGEEQTKVVYKLSDPEQYKGAKVLVVGGGDSALEAACEVAEQPGTDVILIHRSESFSRAKLKNRQRLQKARLKNQLRIFLSSKVSQIGVEDVQIESRETIRTFGNDAVIICAGGVLPTPFLKSIGIEVETKHGAA